MDKAQARRHLVEARNALDEAAKKVLEGFGGITDEQMEEARNLAREDERGKLLTIYDETVLVALGRVQAAFDQWEISESVPLQEDRTFMDAFHVLLREVGDFKGEAAGGN